MATRRRPARRASSHRRRRRPGQEQVHLPRCLQRVRRDLGSGHGLVHPDRIARSGAHKPHGHAAPGRPRPHRRRRPDGLGNEIRRGVRPDGTTAMRPIGSPLSSRWLRSHPVRRRRSQRSHAAGMAARALGPLRASHHSPWAHRRVRRGSQAARSTNHPIRFRRDRWDPSCGLSHSRLPMESVPGRSSTSRPGSTAKRSQCPGSSSRLKAKSRLRVEPCWPGHMVPEVCRMRVPHHMRARRTSSRSRSRSWTEAMSWWPATTKVSERPDPTLSRRPQRGT
jgi:hypothetical protein